MPLKISHFFSFLNINSKVYLFSLSDATSDLAAIMAPDMSRSGADDSAASKSNNFLSSESGQQRVRSLSDSRSDGQKKQSKLLTFVRALCFGLTIHLSPT